MVVLVSDGRACGMAMVAEVCSVYATLTDALAQLVVDEAQGRTPLRIVDEATGAVLWAPEERKEAESWEA